MTLSDKEGAEKKPVDVLKTTSPPASTRPRPLSANEIRQQLQGKDKLWRVKSNKKLYRQHGKVKLPCLEEEIEQFKLFLLSVKIKKSKRNREDSARAD
jgi:hypothetical protein